MYSKAAQGLLLTMPRTQPATIIEPVAAKDRDDVPIVPDQQQPASAVAESMASSTKFFDRKKFWS